MIMRSYAVFSMLLPLAFAQPSLQYVRELENCVSSQAIVPTDFGDYQRRWAEAENYIPVTAELYFISAFSFEVHSPTASMALGIPMSATFSASPRIELSTSSG